MTEQKIPNWAMYSGKRVRVLYYHSRDRFMVLDGSERRLVHRDRLTFLPDKPKK